MTQTASDAVLVINAGSATIKFSVYGASATADATALRYRGLVEQVGTQGHFRLVDASGGAIVDRALVASNGQAVAPAQLLQVALRGLNRMRAGCIGWRPGIGWCMVASTTVRRCSSMPT